MRLWIFGFVMIAAMIVVTRWPVRAAQRGREVRVIPAAATGYPVNIPGGVVVGFACTASQCYVAIQ